PADAVQPVFDGGIADAEVLLHLLDGSVAAHERRDEHLVFCCELGERRQDEMSFHGEVLVDEPDSLDFDSRSARQLGELLPVLGHKTIANIAQNLKYSISELSLLSLSGSLRPAQRFGGMTVSSTETVALFPRRTRVPRDSNAERNSGFCHSPDSMPSHANAT